MEIRSLLLLALSSPSRLCSPVSCSRLAAPRLRPRRTAAIRCAIRPRVRMRSLAGQARRRTDRTQRSVLKRSTRRPTEATTTRPLAHSPSPIIRPAPPTRPLVQMRSMPTKRAARIQLLDSSRCWTTRSATITRLTVLLHSKATPAAAITRPLAVVHWKPIKPAATTRPLVTLPCCSIPRIIILLRALRHSLPTPAGPKHRHRFAGPAG